jgi:hypothetical protein
MITGIPRLANSVATFNERVIKELSLVDPNNLRVDLNLRQHFLGAGNVRRLMLPLRIRDDVALRLPQIDVPNRTLVPSDAQACPAASGGSPLQICQRTSNGDCFNPNSGSEVNVPYRWCKRAIMG